jgi:2-polyprenyl-6-hydroxyphenyl methylase / 3-demethylubiquinone-9 3-methyltransferase
MTETTAHAPAHTAAPTLDPEEVARFSRLADAWWDPNGKFRPLHKIGPPRIQFVRDTMIAHFSSTAAVSNKVGGLKPLAGLTVIDIGCGGGLVAEPLTRLGATVTGIDPAEKNILIAKGHADGQGLAIDYRAVRAEDLVAEGRTYDAVVCLEVVEHVPDVPAFLKVIGALVRPGGVLIVSTINRTLKAYALAIIGAEYVLRWLPVGTHQWDRFVTPDELRRGIEAAGFSSPSFRGMTYNPLTDIWSLNTDTDVNYLASAAKAG